MGSSPRVGVRPTHRRCHDLDHRRHDGAAHTPLTIGLDTGSDNGNVFDDTSSGDVAKLVACSAMADVEIDDSCFANDARQNNAETERRLER